MLNKFKLCVEFIGKKQPIMGVFFLFFKFAENIEFGSKMCAIRLSVLLTTSGPWQRGLFVNIGNVFFFIYFAKSTENTRVQCQRNYGRWFRSLPSVQKCFLILFFPVAVCLVLSKNVPSLLHQKVLCEGFCPHPLTTPLLTKAMPW